MMIKVTTHSPFFNSLLEHSRQGFDKKTHSRYNNHYHDGEQYDSAN
jgi:hypothetical protein